MDWQFFAGLTVGVVFCSLAVVLTTDIGNIIWCLAEEAWQSYVARTIFIGVVGLWLYWKKVRRTGDETLVKQQFEHRGVIAQANPGRQKGKHGPVDHLREHIPTLVMYLRGPKTLADRLYANGHLSWEDRVDVHHHKTTEAQARALMFLLMEKNEGAWLPAFEDFLGNEQAELLKVIQQKLDSG